MVSKIVRYLLFFFVLLALFLYSINVSYVGFGSAYTNFFMRINDSMKTLGKIKIPNIPMLNQLENANFFEKILNVFIFIVDILITFFNGVISVLNLFITVLMYVIAIMQSIFTLGADFFNQNLYNDVPVYEWGYTWGIAI